MTIFIDPYHTTAGAVHAMDRVTSLLKESVVRDSLAGTNLGVRTESGVTPVFITGCRDSERNIPLFTHPISINNFNKSSYLFTDVRLFMKSGAVLPDLTGHIRRQEEFDFTKMRQIASLAWVTGDYSRFNLSMRFCSDVYAAWISQVVAKTFALDFVEQTKVQMIAMAYYESLFHSGAVNYAECDDQRMAVANYYAQGNKIPFTQVNDFLKTLKPMSSVTDLCAQIEASLDNVRLKDFNFRVLLNLISTSWFATNSKEILPVALEHPPTWCAIVYTCIRYGNFRKSVLGQTVSSITKRGGAEGFANAFDSMVQTLTQEQGTLKSVMEYLAPSAGQEVFEVPDFE